MSIESGLPIRHTSRIWLYAFGGLVLLFLIIPSVIVVLMSFSAGSFLQFPPQSWSLRWYWNYFGSIEWREATWVSVKVALMTVLVATPLGTAAAYAINLKTLRFGNVALVLLIAAIIVPVILIGIGIFFLYAKLGLNNTLAGLVIAHSTQAMPFVVLTVLAGFRSYDMDQERVACSLGAGPLAAFFQVTLPQIRFSIIAGALFAFITSFDEVVVSFFVSGGDTSTLTRRMFTALRDEINPTIAAISTCLISLSIVLLAAMQWLGGKKE